MSQVEGTISKCGEEDLCPGGGEELSSLDEDKIGIQIRHGRNAGVGTSSRHRTKKGAEPIREKDCLNLDTVVLDIACVKRLLCIGIFCPTRSSLLVPARPRKRGGDAIDGIIDKGKDVPRHMMPGTIIIVPSTSSRRCSR